MMTLQARLMLFVLSSLAMVVIPAVMVSLYHDMLEIAPRGGIALALVSIVPLGIVMLMCFFGLYHSIFRPQRG